MGNDVYVPFGPCHGWPLAAVLEKRPEEYRRLRKLWKAGKLYGAIAREMAELEKTPAAKDLQERANRKAGRNAGRRVQRRVDDAWLRFAMR